jgi:hypothetical protein
MNEQKQRNKTSVDEIIDLILTFTVIHWVGGCILVKTKLNSVALVRERTVPSDRRLSAKLVPTFTERGCRVVSATDPHGR